MAQTPKSILWVDDEGELLESHRIFLRSKGYEVEWASNADDAVEIFKVPGSFELPLTSLKAAESGKFDAVIALGVVIRGETPHFDYVAGEAASGIARASLETRVPISFGVITANTVEQAINRAGAKAGNKGYEAAMAAVEIVNLHKGMEARKSATQIK